MVFSKNVFKNKKRWQNKKRFYVYAVWTGPGSFAHGKLPMYSVHTRDHFNYSPLLFTWSAPQNRCGQTGKRGKVGWGLSGNFLKADAFPITQSTYWSFVIDLC